MSVILQTMLAMFETGENTCARFRREDSESEKIEARNGPMRRRRRAIISRDSPREAIVGFVGFRAVDGMSLAKK
jgi:hypothetical protein